MKHKLIKLTAGALATLHALNAFIDSTIVYTTGHAYCKSFDTSQGTIYYRVEGHGEPILLIHDLNIFASEREWNEIIPALAKEHTVYVLDLLGCGKSDKPNITYTSYLYVQQITAFVNTVIKEAPVVVTSGFSASFVIMADAMTPDLFASIQMINPPSLHTLSVMPNWRSRMVYHLFKLPIIGRSLYYVVANRANVEDYLTEECFYNPFDLKQSVVRSGYEAAHRNKGKGRYLFSSLEGKYMNIDISPAIEKTNTKLTIIVGEHAEAMNTVAAYQSLNSSINMEVVNDTKKLPHLEKPDAVSSMILSAI